MIPSTVLPIKLGGNKHAIKEVIISLFFASPILESNRFSHLLDQDFVNDFNRFEEASSADIEPSSSYESDAIVSLDKNAGFQFLYVQEDSKKVKKILQVRNEEGRTFLSFHDLEYTRWNNFLDKFYSLSNSLAPYISDNLVIAFGLSYVDEILWTDLDSFHKEKILKQDGYYIPEFFIKNQNGQLNLVAEKEDGDFTHLDSLRISSYVSDGGFVNINHNVIHKFDNVATFKNAISEETLKNLLQKAHDYNKYVLRSILQDDVLSLIGL